MSIKRKIKILSLALAAAFAFSAVAAAATQANAPRWTVGSTTIGAGVSEAFTASNTGTVTFNIPALGVEFTSTSNGDCVESGKILGSPSGVEGDLTSVITCKNVETNIPACTVTTEDENVHGVISILPLVGRLVWVKDQGDLVPIGILWEPEESSKLLFTGHNPDKCPLSGTYGLTGCFITEASPVTSDVSEGKLIAPATAMKSYWTNQTPTRTKDECKGLKFGGNSMTFTGTFDMKLTSGKTFGIEPG